jgi:two-component system NarL family sensor kinase
MKKSILYSIAFLIIGITGMTQAPANKDSLLHSLQIAKEDTAKVLLYLAAGYEYEQDNPDTAAMYYLQAGNLSKRLNYKRGMIKFVSNYTGLLNVKGEFDSSLLLNKQSVQVAKELNDDVLIAKTTANTGNSFNYLGEYDSAVYYYETAIKYFDKISNPYFSARMSDLMQSAYFRLGQYEKGVQSGKAAVDYFRKEEKEMELGQALLNLANNYPSVDRKDSALACYKEALAIAVKTAYKDLELSSLIGIGNIYFHRYDADAMRPYYEPALALSKETGNVEGEVIAGRGMALYNLLKKDFEASKNYISASLKLADSLGLKKEKFEDLKVMSAILFALHDVVGAERILDSSEVVENELRGEEVQNKTLLLEKKFETEKKEAQIKLQQAELRQKSTLNKFLIAGAVALIIISLLGYRNYKNRQKLQQVRINDLEKEKQLTATEAVLKGEEQERTRLAKDLHDGLGGMLSGIKHSLSNIQGNLIMTPDNARAFERSIDMLDSSIGEMRRVAHNMMPEILIKYGLDTALKEFCGDIDRSGVIHVNYQSVGMQKTAIDQTTAVTIYRIAQELVNNTIKHAQAKNILVQLHQSAQEKLLAITVEDDGKGFDTTILDRPGGIGWQSIKNRVEFLKGRIDIQSSAGKGTSVLIEIII